MPDMLVVAYSRMDMGAERFTIRAMGCTCLMSL